MLVGISRSLAGRVRSLRSGHGWSKAKFVDAKVAASKSGASSMLEPEVLCGVVLNKGGNTSFSTSG